MAANLCFASKTIVTVHFPLRNAANTMFCGIIHDHDDDTIAATGCA